MLFWELLGKNCLQRCARFCLVFMIILQLCACTRPANQLFLFLVRMSSRLAWTKICLQSLVCGRFAYHAQTQVASFSVLWELLLP